MIWLRRAVLAGWLAAISTLLAVVLVKLWDIDDQLTEHERAIGNLEAGDAVVEEMARLLTEGRP